MQPDRRLYVQHVSEPARNGYRLARLAITVRRLPSDLRLRTITDADDRALANVMEQAYAGQSTSSSAETATARWRWPADVS